MHPIFCQIGPFSVYSYGLFLAIGVFVSSWLLASEAKRIGVSRDTVYDLAFWVVLFGIVGARLFYIFLNFSYFIQNPAEIIMLQKGGLAWQGSFIGGLASGVVFLRRKNIPLWKFLDTMRSDASAVCSMAVVMGSPRCGGFFFLFGKRVLFRHRYSWPSVRSVSFYC